MNPVITPVHCNVVIFGGNGDLAIRKLLPALYHLERDGHICAIGDARHAQRETSRTTTTTAPPPLCYWQTLAMVRDERLLLDLTPVLRSRKF